MNTLDKYVQKHIVKYSGAGPISKGGGASSNLSMSLDTAALAGRIDDIEEQLKLIAASLKNYHTLSITFENIDLPLVDIHVSGGMAVLSGYTEVIPETTITVDTSLWVAGVNKYIVWYNGTIVVADEILEGYKLLAYIIIPEDWDGTVSNSYKDGAAYISIAGPIDELDPYYGEVLILELDAEAGPFFCIVHASWDPLGSPDVSHYILSYTIDGNNWENISTANPAASFEAPHNIQVAAKVQAVFNNGRKTHWSATEIIQTPGDDTIPLPVTGLEVTSQFGIIKAIWDESTDIDFDTFEIQVARDDQFTDPEVTFTTNTSYAFAGEPEATYYIRVRVIDYSSNTSLWSDTIEIETVMGDGNTPAAPTGLTLVPILEDETSYITATWDRNEELDIVSYELAISYDQTNWVDYQTPKTTKTIEVVGGVTLYAKVRALDNEGLVSAWSDIVETTTAHDTEAPNIPVGLTITNSFGIVYFTWTANGESDFSHYIIQISQTDQFSTYDEVIQRTNSYSFSGIPGTTYYVRIKSVDYSGNESDWSSIASTTVTAGDGQPPATPTGLSLTTYLQSYSSYIEATWDENEEVDLLGYQIAWSLDQLKWNILSVNSPEANFSVPGNSTIYVKVKALDVEGLASQWSDAESITSTEDEEAPATPVLLSNIPLYARALIEIEEQEESDFSHFLVSYKDRSFTTSTTNIEIPLDPGESGVSVSIKAVDLSGNESPALAVSASARTLSEAEEEFFELINKVHGGSTNTETIAYITDDLVDHMNITKPTAFDRSGLLKDDVYDTIDRIDNIDYGDLTLPMESVFERIDTDFISVGSSLSEARSKIFDIEIGEEIKNIDEWVGVINTDVSDITTRIDFINYGELTGTIETVLGSVYSNVSAISEKIYDIVIGEITLDIDEWIDQINSDLSGVTTRINAVVYGSLTDTIEDVLAAVHGDISGIETKVFDIEIGEVTHDIDEWMGLLNGDVAGIISRLENVSYNETTDTIETQIAAIALDINGLSSIVYDITIDETTQDVNQWISTLSQRADSIELSISGISQTVGEHTSSISQMSIDISGIEAVVYNITIDTVTQDVDQWVSQIKQEADAITLRLDHVVIDEDDQTLEQHVSQIKLDISGIESVVYDITIDTVTQDINQWVSTLSQRSDSIELSVQGLSQTVGEHSSSLSQLTIDVSGIEGVVYNIQIGEDAQDVDQWISTLSQRADSIELSVSGLSSDVGENSASISQLVIDVSGIEGVVYDITVGEATQNVDQWVSQIKQEADAITLRLDHVVIDEDDLTLEQHVSQIKLDISGIESVVYDIQIGETTQDINQWISTLSQRADSIELNVSGISETVGTHTTNISSLQLDVSGIEAIVKDITIDTVTQDINEWVSQIKQEADAITLRLDNVVVDESTKTVEQHLSQIVLDIDGIEAIVKDITIDEVTQDVDLWISTLSQRADSIELSVQTVSQTVEGHTTTISQLSIDVSGIEGIVYNIEIGEDQYDVDQWISVLSQRADSIELSVTNLSGDVGTNTASIGQLTIDVEGIKTLVYDVTVGDVTHDIDEWLSALSQEDISIKQDLEAAALALRSKIESEFTNAETVLYIVGDPLDHQTDTAPINYDRTTSIFDITYDTFERLNNFEIDGVTGTIEYWASSISQTTQNITLRIDGIVYDGEQKTLEQAFSEIEMNIDGITSTVYDLEIDGTTQNIDQWVSQIKQETDNITFRLDHFVIDQEDMTAEQHVSQLKLSIDGLESVVYSIQVDEITQDVDLWISTLSQRADGIELNVSTLSSTVDGHTSSISSIQLDVGAIELIVKDITVDETTQDADEWISQIKQEADAITLRLDHIVIDEDDQTLEQHVSQFRLDIDGITSIVTDITVGEDTQDVDQWVSTLSQRADSIELSITGLTSDVGTNTSNISQLLIDVSGIELIVKSHTIGETTQDLDLWVTQIKQEADAITLRLDGIEIDEETKTIEQHLAQIVLDIDGIESIVYNITIGEDQYDVDGWISVLSQRADAIELSVSTLEDNTTTSLSALSIQVGEIEAIVYDIEIGEDTYDVKEWVTLLKQTTNSISLAVEGLETDLGTAESNISQLQISVGSISSIVRNVEIEGVTKNLDVWVSEVKQTAEGILARVDAISYNGEEGTIEEQFAALSLDISGLSSKVYSINIDGNVQDIDEWLATLNTQDETLEESIDDAVDSLRIKINSEFADASTLMYIAGDLQDHQSLLSPISYDRVDSIFDVAYNTLDRLNLFEVNGITDTIEYWVSSINQTANNIELRVDGITYNGETKTLEQAFSAIELDIDGITSTVYNIEIDGTTQDIDQWVSQIKQEADNITLRLDHVVIDENDQTLEQHISLLRIDVDGITSIVTDITIDEETYDVNQWVSVLSQRSDAIELSVSTLSGDVASAISQLTIDVSGIEGVVYNITIDETTQNIDEWVSQIKQEADAITLRLDHVVIGEDDQTLEQHVSQIKIDIGGVESIVYDIQIGETTQDVNEWVSQIKQESDAIELRVETAEGTITSHSSSISSLNLSVDGIEAVVYNIAVEEEGDTHDVDEWLALFHIRENAIELSVTNLSTTVSSNTQSISSIEVDVGAIDLRVQTVESTTSTHTTQISDLDIALGTITATVGSIEDTVDGHTSSISQIELDISGITSTVQTISDTVGGHTSQISQINQDIGSIELAVQEVEEDVGTNTSAIAQIELSIDGITTSISTLETTVGGHTSQISQIELDIGTIELSVSSISSTVGQHTIDISAINVSLGEITTIVGTIEEDLDQEGDPLTQTYNYSLFQQLADSIALRVVAVDEFGDPQATELIIEDGLVTIAADQFRVHGDAMINGSISGEKLKANSVETNKLIVWPDIPIDDETAEYWGTSLLGALGITLPDGMDEVTKENLADLLPPGTILAEYFAVGQKMVVGNKVVIERDLDDYGHMTVFDSDYEIVVKVGENATPDGRDGMFINTGGAFQVGQLVDPNYLRYYNGILTIKGVIEATGGFFDEVVYVGVEEGERILLDGVNKLIRSENYQAGTAGFELNGDGTAEFNNITVRGSVHASEGSIDGVMTIGDIEIGVGVNEGAGTGWFVDENNYWYSNLGFSIGNGTTNKFQYSPKGGLEIVTTKILVDIDENILIDSENKVIAIGTMTGFDTASGNGVFTGMYNSKPSFKVGQNDPDGDLQKGISYYDGVFSFMGAVISMENLDDPTQEALSGYEVMISPAGDSVYNDGTTRTPASISFTATLLRKVDNTLVSSGLAYYWTVETDGGITIPSGALTATATVNTSSMTGPSVIKVKVTYQEKDYYGYASLAYSEKGTGGDDAVIYWLTSSKDKVVYNPNTGLYDGGASSSIVFTAKEAVGQVVQNKTGLYWKVNGVNAEPDANGYQKTVLVSSQTTTTIEIYADFAREQLLDTFTVPVITEGSDSYSIILSNEHQTVESNYDGTSPTPASISTQVKLYKGTTEITSFTVEATGATVDGKTVTVTIPSSSTMAGSQDITVKIDSTIIGVKTLTWSKSPQGEPGIGGEDAQALFLTADAQIFKADQDNTITSGDITLEAFLQNLSGTITWTAKNQSNNDITLTGTGSTRTLTAANFGASDWVKITVSLGGLSDSITIVRVKEGSNAIVGFLTNESHNVPCDSDGSNPDFTGASSILKIFRGNTQETSGWSCSWSLITGTATGQASTTTLTNDTITIQSLSTDVAVYRCTATKSGQSSVVKDFTITKSYAGDPGDPGADATSYYITSTKDKIVYDPGTGQYDGGATTTVTLSGWRKEGTNSPQATSFYWKRGATALGAGTSKTITVPTDTSSSFTMTAYIDSSYTYLAASFTVAIVASGEPGDPGGDGVTRYISATKDKVVYDPNTGLYDGSASTTITFTAKKVVGDESPANETVYWKRGSTALGSGTSKSVVVPTDTNTSFTMYTYVDSGYTILLSSFTVSVIPSGASIYALPTASAYHVEYNGSSYSPSSVTITPALKQGTTSLSFTNWRIKYINISGDLITINRSTSSAYSFSMSLAQFIVPKTDVVLIIEIDYGGVTYTARLIIVVEDTRYGWLSQWTGTTLIGGTYIVTPTAFMGTDANNGVLIDANGILGKKSGAKTFELTDDGDLDVASGRIGGSSGWLIETLSGKGRISSTGIELVSGDDAYIQAGSSEENYRMNANGLEYRRLIKARINNIKAYAECDASASAIIEVWYRWTENYSDASPTWSGWQHPDDLNFSASFTWYISPTDPIYGADMTDFAMQFKFVIYSTSVFKAKLQKWNVYINDEPSLTVEIDTMEQFQAHADATTSGITYSSGGYVQPTSYSSSGTYVTKASSIREEIEPGTDISKVLHSIHKGTIYFDGTSGDMSKRIQHNKHIMPTRYDVILNESSSQIWKSSFSTGTNYTRKIEVTKAEDYFDILFCAEEGTTSTNIGTIGMQSNDTWLILANVANCSKIEFDVYHWGGFRIFKEHVSHSFSSPYTGDIGYKYYAGILYLSWNGDTTPEYQIEGLVGMVAARDIIKWTSGTRYPLTGNFNYEIQVWQ